MPKTRGGKLTERQKRFVDFYIKTLNASEAARKAGYSKKTAPRTGAENLQKPQIQAAIQKRLQKLESARIADTKEALEALTRVLRREEYEETQIAGRTKTDDPLKVTKVIKSKTDIRNVIEAAKTILEYDKLKQEASTVETVQIIDDTG